MLVQSEGFKSNDDIPLAGSTLDPVKTKSNGAHKTSRANTEHKGDSDEPDRTAWKRNKSPLWGTTSPTFKAGDTIRVGFKVTEGTRTRVQNYEGVCIARNNGSTASPAPSAVRKISFGEGVERVFPLHSTNIDSITVVRRGRVRRAKLYYLACASR